MTQQTINHGSVAGDGTGESPFSGMQKVNANFTELYAAKDAQAAALAAKAPLDNPTFTGTVNGITKAMVGLGNVDNVSDANKPVSTAQNAAIVAGDNLRLKASDMYGDFVVSGLATPVPNNTLDGVLAVGVAYVNGVRTARVAADTYTYLALRDTYVDMDSTGALYRNAVVNGNAAPTLVAGRIRLEKVVTDGSKISQVFRLCTDGYMVHGVKDSSNNLIGFRDPVTQDLVAFPHRLDTNGLMLLGDSTVEQNSRIALGLNLGYEIIENTNGFAIWMNALLKEKRFDRLYNYGLSGRRAWQCVIPPGAANYSATNDIDLLLAACPAYDVLIKLGINDVPDSESMTSDVIIANLSSIALKAKKAGRRVTFMPIDPRRIADTAWTTTAQQKALRVNAGMKKLCVQNGFGYVQTAEVLTDYTVTASFESPATTGRRLYDNVHENSYGAFRQALILADYFSQIRPYRPLPTPMHFIDDSSGDTSNINLLDNPMFNGTTGYTLPTVSGIVSAVSTSVIVAPDGVGNALQIDVSTNAAGTVNLFFAAIDNTPALIAGDTIIPMARVLAEALGGGGAPTALKSVGISARYANQNGDFRAAETYCLISATANEWPVDRALDLFIMPTAAYQVTGNEIGLNPYMYCKAEFTGAGSARFTISSCGVIKNMSYYTNSSNPWK